jgi:hypothetical protein
VTFLNRHGAPVSHFDERKILSGCLAVPAAAPGERHFTRGALPAYFAWLALAVSELDSESSKISPLFTVSPDGVTVTAVTEDGRALCHARLLVLGTYIDLKLGVTDFPVPPDMPDMALRLISTFGRRARLDGGRDALAWTRDGLLLAARISAYMRTRGLTLAALDATAPACARDTREIPLTSGRAKVMRSLVAAFGAEAATESGLELRPGGGVVRIAPARADNAVRIRAEAASSDAAKRLIADAERRIREIDG